MSSCLKMSSTCRILSSSSSLSTAIRIRIIVISRILRGRFCWKRLLFSCSSSTEKSCRTFGYIQRITAQKRIDIFIELCSSDNSPLVSTFNIIGNFGEISNAIKFENNRKIDTIGIALKKKKLLDTIEYRMRLHTTISSL